MPASLGCAGGAHVSTRLGWTLAPLTVVDVAAQLPHARVALLLAAHGADEVKGRDERDDCKAGAARRGEARTGVAGRRACARRQSRSSGARHALAPSAPAETTISGSSNVNLGREYAPSAALVE